MRKQYFLFLLPLIILILNTITVFSQINPHDPGGQIGTILGPLIKLQFGEQYFFKYQVIDSVINGFGDDNREEILDPYGTLTGCVIFSIFKKQNGFNISDSSRFGIFKNGTIIWVSRPIIKGAYTGLFATRDVNNDGQVEILTKWSGYNHLSNELIENLWIIKWDGSAGTIINAIDNYGNSVIISLADLFELFDIEGNGIYKIRTYWLNENDDGSELFPINNISTRPYVTYEWDGSLYRIALGANQIPASAFLPSNRLNVEVVCQVGKYIDSLQYSYTWKNLKNSKQRMATFSMVGISGSFKNKVIVGWRYMGTRRGLMAYGWEPEIYEIEKTIGRDISIQGLVLTSKKTPSIVPFITQGFRPYPLYDLKNPNNKELSKNDYLNNSFKGFTIGPADSPNPFVPLNFLDTISSYIHQSHTLGWINNTRDDDAEEDENAEDGIVKNLDNRLGKVRDFIVKKKYDRVQNQLEKFLNKVEKLWIRQQKENAKNKKNPKIIFTSEAYALLKYNAEYLQQQLPGKK